MKYNERIRAIREDKDLTQEEIAKILLTNQRKISRIELGIQDPGIDEIKRLCFYYNLSADYILGFIDTPRKLYEKSPRHGRGDT